MNIINPCNQPRRVFVQQYPATIRQLDEEEGGGFLVEFPDLPGCAADGETRLEALENADAAITDWISAAEALGRVVPQPLSHDMFSGKWVQRVPKSLHMKLVTEAKKEGVSLNSLAISLLSEGLGKKSVTA